MKIIFMGTPEFSVPTFLALINAKHEIECVYTKPPKPKGRGYHVQKSPVHDLADQNNIPVCTPLNLKEESANIKKINPDVIIVIAYGHIVPKNILEIPRLGCINVHASILPKYRGAAPIHHAILNGESETGTTIMQMDEGLDTGPIYSIKKIQIEESDTTVSLYNKLKDLGARHLLEVLQDDNKILTKQENESASFAPKVNKMELDPSKNATILSRQVRALSPHPGVFYKDIKIIKAKPIESTHSQNIGSFEKIGDQIMLMCNSSMLLLESVQKKGSTIMSAKDWFNGLNF